MCDSDWVWAGLKFQDIPEAARALARGIGLGVGYVGALRRWRQATGAELVG